MTPTFDSARGLVYISIGGPDPTAFPPPAEPHPGDMRWTNSTCALHIETGKVPANAFGNSVPVPAATPHPSPIAWEGDSMSRSHAEGTVSSIPRGVMQSFPLRWSRIEEAVCRVKWALLE